MPSKLPTIALSAFLAVLGWGPASAMEFSEHFNGAARIDSESTWIYADGEITAETPAQFEAFIKTVAIWKRQRIVLNSGGGSVIGGIRLGEIIRKNGFRTAVSKTVKIGEFSEPAPGICASACVFALAGGVERDASEGSRVGVHQMGIDFARLYGDKPVSVEDLTNSFSTPQQALSLVLTHFMAMGIDPSIIEMMVERGANDMKWLTIDEIRRANIAFAPNALDKWQIEGYGKGIVAFARSKDARKQVTIFCRAKNMRFTVTAKGSPYSSDFIKDTENFEEIHVAGKDISRKDIKLEVKGDVLTISGPWVGNLAAADARVTMAPFGVVGTIRDVYSLYGFNNQSFEQNVRLAGQNCIA
ncbi:hypothetical protein [Bosea robiniae]|uniref:Uncharacterized protein n=1 Tax=Bosea robiniae TaxID=1036780 RepID=A0ABY0P4N4_9HYPH|nr:hypothetical protein [Bosea robiniae]SDH22582.1 hypothetical protein SAMN05421844_107212 [Bosea robiniae]